MKGANEAPKGPGTPAKLADSTQCSHFPLGMPGPMPDPLAHYCKIYWSAISLGSLGISIVPGSS